MFEKFTDKIAVNCRTEQEAKEFHVLMANEKWGASVDYLSTKFLWDKDYSCYFRDGFVDGIMRCAESTAKYRGLKVYTYPEFLKLIGKDKPLIVKQDKYEVGDRVKIIGKKQMNDIYNWDDIQNCLADKIFTIKKVSGKYSDTDEHSCNYVCDGQGQYAIYGFLIEGKVIDTPEQSITLPPDVAKFIQKDRMTYVELTDGNSGKSYCNETDTFNRAEGFRLAYQRAKKEIPQTVKGKTQPKPESKVIEVGDWVKLVDVEGARKGIFSEVLDNEERIKKLIKGVLVKRVVGDILRLEINNGGYAWAIESKFFVKIPTPKGAK